MTAAKNIYRTDICRVFEIPERYRAVIRDIDQEIEQVRAGFCAGSPGMSFAPGGGSKRDLSTYYARVEDLIKCRKAAVDRREMAVQAVLVILEGCENEDARRLLQLVYVQGMSRREAAEMCNKSYDCAYKIMQREISRLIRKYQEGTEKKAIA